MNNVVGLREFREHLPKYEKRIAEGETFVILKKSKPIFTVGPVDEGNWECILDFTAFKKEGIPINELIERLERLEA